MNKLSILKKMTIVSSALLAGSFSTAQDYGKDLPRAAPLAKLEIDRAFNLFLTDGENRKPERCLKPVSGKHGIKPLDRSSAMPALDDRICRIYQKPAKMLENKMVNLMLHKGSYIFTLADSNGEIYQMCFDDYWNRVDCSDLD